MAKCPICNTRKGKRKCAVAKLQFICSLCCGSTPKQTLCLSCTFYQPPQYNYDAVPTFSTSVMANNHALQNYYYMLENAFATGNAQDITAIIELLINKYYFKETEIKADNPLWQSGFNAADNIIQHQLKDVDEETLINLLGAMRLAIKPTA